MKEAWEVEYQEQNIYHTDYVEHLIDDDAISLEEAGFLEGYNS